MDVDIGVDSGLLVDRQGYETVGRVDGMINGAGKLLRTSRKRD
jgi:hypothetical protein